MTPLTLYLTTNPHTRAAALTIDALALTVIGMLEILL